LPQPSHLCLNFWDLSDVHPEDLAPSFFHLPDNGFAPNDISGLVLV
jgi:hypothetical protein